MGKSEHARGEGECLKGIVMLPPGTRQPHWQGENHLPAPAGLHHSGFLCIFLQSISALEHPLLSPEPLPGKPTYVALHASPQSTAASSPGTPCMPAHPWHHAACPRCAGFVHDPTVYNCKFFNVHAVAPPAPFFSRVEMSFHLLRHILGRTGRMELRVSN